MKKMSQLKLSFLILISFPLLFNSCKTTNDTSTMNVEKPDLNKRVSVLHTNDIHGSYMPFQTTLDNATAQTGDSIDNPMRFKKLGEIGGIAWMATAVKSIRQQKGTENVILLDGGDTFSDDQLGNITKGEAMIRMMNELDYDLMVLGNHDFDYSLKRTRELEKMANFPMRAANIIDQETGNPIFRDPYKLFKRDGLNIGVLPVGYRNTPLTGNPKNIQGLKFTSGLEAIEKYLPELKTKADIIILLSHEGMAVDKIIAEKINGIDIIIGAHSHDVIEPPIKINQTYLVQALSDAAVLGETELLITNKKLTGINTQYHYLWHDKYTADQNLEQLIQQLREPHVVRLEENISRTDTVIGRQYKSESPFDKVVTNIMKEEYNTDVAFLPGVGYGISLKEDITSENIYKLLPHPAKIVTLQMTGSQIRKTLEQTATNLKPENKIEVVGGLIQSSGIHYHIDLSKPIGDRVSGIKIKNQPIVDSEIYNVSTHSGMLSGIHNYVEFAKGTNIHKTKVVLTEFILEEFREMTKIEYPENMGEVTVVK
ncbi:bifunctional metallophosphatase/5'-nucleotidase [Salegentibacter sp. UBA1130]|uniref:bifunctional metallophosphatase/5'-nucleotidase n=2 Tax=unclassified Salegentibacter TaxID=2633436 RepID=UPI001AAEBEC7|nr:bifunctional UDP-sugar hydrolase/5'-nucleotidase [Salegentibacter sp. UBA1130]MBO2545338.1 5'-nucleotidase C-terminal domain-containing protein [Salegentibacter sp. BDJ18]